MQRICVLAGSQEGKCSDYALHARLLGKDLAERGLTLIYAGAGVGLMAAAADSARLAGGEVIAVQCQSDQPCGGRGGPSTSHLVASSPVERTAVMGDLADGIIALPGGMGTFYELFTFINWAQLGCSAKPIGLLNIGGFFDPLLLQITYAESSGFITSGRAPCIVTARGVPALLDALATAATVSPHHLASIGKEVAR